MKPRYWIWVVLLILLAAPAAVAQTGFILHAPLAEVPGIAVRNNLTVVRQLYPSWRNIFLVTVLDNRAPSQVVASVKTDPGVQGGKGNIELDGAAVLPELASGTQLDQSTVGILDALSDRTSVSYFGSTVWAGYVNQTAAQIIRVADAQHSYGSGSGTIAVIDTGIDPYHPVFVNSLVLGHDFTQTPDVDGPASELTDLVDQSTVAILDQSSTSMVDKTIAVVNQSTVAILDQSTVGILDTTTLPAAFGHGTMVAGAAKLVCPGCKIMPLKVFDRFASATLSNLVSAVYWAVAHGANVIQMSFSMDVSSDELLAAIGYANSKRVICVASAGNSGLQTIVYPAGWKKASGVGSTDNYDVRSVFSNYGANLVSFAAPGERVLLPYPYNNYAAAWGTSFSTPLASGGAGLLLQIDPKINQDQVATSLSQAQALLGQGLGAGRIDLYRACQYWTLHKSK